MICCCIKIVSRITRHKTSSVESEPVRCGQRSLHIISKRARGEYQFMVGFGQEGNALKSKAVLTAREGPWGRVISVPAYPSVPQFSKA